MKNQGNNTVNSVLKDRGQIQPFVTWNQAMKEGWTPEIRMHFLQVSYNIRSGEDVNIHV